MRVLLSFAAVIAAFSALAQPMGGNSVSAGAAVIVRDSPYRGETNDLLVVPVITAQYGRFWFRGITGGYNVFTSPRLQASIIAGPRFGYDGDEIAGAGVIRDRETTIDAGVAVTVPAGRSLLQFETTTDLLGRHEGHEVSLRYARPFARGALSVVPSAGVLYMSDDLSNYYYGVTSRESLDGVTYDPGAAIVPVAGVVATYRATARIAYIAAVNYRRLSGDIANSPIIESQHDASAFLSVVYRIR